MKRPTPILPVLAFALAVQALGADRPNILFLFADDQRADTIGAHGNPHIRTPNLDRLAAEGFSFTRNYCAGSFSGAVCVASRAMLMTGRHWMNLPRNKPQSNWADATTLPALLTGKGGYNSFIVGKWHNGKRTLDRSFRNGRALYLGGMANHADFQVQDLTDGKLSPKRQAESFSSALFADEAVKFIKDAKTEQPFFLYVAFMAPHDPRNPPEKYRGMYYRDRPPLPPNYLPQHPFQNAPQATSGRDESLAPWPRTKEIVSDQLCEYYGLVTHLDEQVGRVLTALKQSPHADNTLVIYTADHGLAMGSHGLLGKQNVYEQSMRSPLILSGPGVPRGRSSDAYTYIHDLYATLADFAGIARPDGVDARSLRPVMTGEAGRIHDSVFLPFQDNQRAVSDGRWKLHVYPKINHRLLFDLAADPHETRNLAESKPHKAQASRMLALMETHRKRLNDPHPLSFENPEPKTPAYDNSKRVLDRWQPEWIRRKYFAGRDNPNHGVKPTKAETTAMPRPKIRFLNGSDQTMEIFWLKSDKERVSNGAVAPGEDVVIHTTLGHRFVVVSLEDKSEVAIASRAYVQGFRFDPPDKDGIPGFYTQRASAGGFPIVASEKVNPYALKEAVYLANMMLAKRPDVREAMIKSGARLCILAWNEFTCDQPEWRWMAEHPVPGFPGIAPRDYRDARARGMGGSMTDPFCSCAEENLLAYPGDPYAAENIFIHEFAHNIHLRGMSNVDPGFDDRVRRAYNAAMKEGLWKGKYASVNHHEYFAEGVQSWFDDNRENDHDHNHVNTRAELIDYDPGLAALCREVFGDTVLKYTKPATRLHGHLEGYDPSSAPTFVWPGRLDQARKKIRAVAQARSSAAAAAPPKSMPKEDVIDIPAIGKGLCLHNLFQSNMVLQRDKPVAIWGWASPGEKVTVAFAGQTRTTTANQDRSWKITLDPMPANSEPQPLTVKGETKVLSLENILVGDVWILGGQSNMEHPLSRVENGSLEIVSANYSNIRILTVPAQNGPKAKPGFPRLHEWSGWFSRHFRKGDWDVCSPEIARELSAIGYVFARRIHMASQVPIGVIDASRGGTTVETWTPPAVLAGIDTPEVKGLLAEWEGKLAAWDAEADLAKRVEAHHRRVENLKKQGRKIPGNMTVPTDLRPGPAMDHNRPGSCYNSMIAPIAGLSVKGAIFHQGFNNALGSGSSGAAMYYQVFGKMISAWRAAFDDPEMPFGIISLCTAGDPQSRDDYLEKMYDNGIYIREAQYRTFLDFLNAGDKNIGFASSFDKRRSWYHPQVKIPVGERISRWALATQYGFERDIKWKPPMHTGMKVEDDRIILRMDTPVKAVDDGPIVGFAIAGKDRRFHPADAEHLVTGKDRNNRPQYDRRAIVLTSPHVPEPVHFRYAWGRNPMGNLQSSDQNDLPYATQRSDNWKMEKVPFPFPVDESLAPRDQTRRIRNEAMQTLRLEDLGRRLREAQTLIDQHLERYERDRRKWEEKRLKSAE